MIGRPLDFLFGELDSQAKCFGQPASSFLLNSNTLQTPLDIFRPLAAATMSETSFPTNFRLAAPRLKSAGCSKEGLRLAAAMIYAAGTRRPPLRLMQQFYPPHAMRAPQALRAHSQPRDGSLRWAFRRRISNRIGRLLASTVDQVQRAASDAPDRYASLAPSVMEMLKPTQQVSL